MKTMKVSKKYISGFTAVLFSVIQIMPAPLALAQGVPALSPVSANAYSTPVETSVATETSTGIATDTRTQAPNKNLAWPPSDSSIQKTSPADTASSSKANTVVKKSETPVAQAPTTVQPPATSATLLPGNPEARLLRNVQASGTAVLTQTDSEHVSVAFSNNQPTDFVGIEINFGNNPVKLSDITPLKVEIRTENVEKIKVRISDSAGKSVTALSAGLSTQGKWVTIPENFLQQIFSNNEIDWNHIQSIVFFEEGVANGSLEIHTRGLKYAPVIPTSLAVPQGWTRATSNANFAFRKTIQTSEFDRYMQGWTLEVLDLATNKVTVVDQGVIRPDTVKALGDTYDISLDGKSVIYGIKSDENYYDNVPPVYSVMVKNLNGQSISLSGEIKKIVFEGSQARIQISNGTNEFDKTTKWTTVDLSALKVVKEESVIETAVYVIPVLAPIGAPPAKPEIQVQTKLGMAGTYVLESSTDLKTWRTVTTYEVSQPSVKNYYAPLTSPQQYFRVRQIVVPVIPAVPAVTVTRLFQSASDFSTVSLGSPEESTVTKTLRGAAVTFNTDAPGPLNGFAGGGVNFTKSPVIPEGTQNIVVSISATGVSSLKLEIMDRSGKRVTLTVPVTSQEQNVSISVPSLKSMGLNPSALSTILLIADQPGQRGTAVLNIG